MNTQDDANRRITEAVALLRYPVLRMRTLPSTPGLCDERCVMEQGRDLLRLVRATRAAGLYASEDVVRFVRSAVRDVRKHYAIDAVRGAAQRKANQGSLTDAEWAEVLRGADAMRRSLKRDEDPRDAFGNSLSERHVASGQPLYSKTNRAMLY